MINYNILGFFIDLNKLRFLKKLKIPVFNNKNGF